MIGNQRAGSWHSQFLGCRAAHNENLFGGAAFRGLVARHGYRIRKAALAQEFEPAGLREQRVRGPEIAVTESPPAFSKTKDEVGPLLRAGAFEQNEHAVGREQS